ncbi:MAG TPA: hypothetical protein VJ021_04225 [Thermoplasmata archaeon]|nr:hypothetical protein [Thermoplasmata archaeon]
MSNEATSSPERSSYVGWIAAGIVLLVTFGAATILWFIFHP